MDNFRKYIVEFIGTFFLVFAIGMIAMLPGNGVIAAIAIGLVLMVMIYAGGFISGGHYNPAVSLAAALRGALPAEDFVPYVVSQVLGAVSAVLLIGLLTDIPEMTICTYSMSQILIGEFLFTFLLCFVVLSTTTSRETEGNSYYGFAIGSTVTIGAFIAGGVICYGAFNPAVAIGLWMLKLSCMWLTIITILANIFGAIAAAYIYRYVTGINKYYD